MKNYFQTWCAQKKAKYFPLKKAIGSLLSSHNKTIYDLSSVSYQASFGLQNKIIENAISSQMKKFSVASPKSEFTLKNTVTKKLIDLIGFDGRIFYTLSGAESIENAIKMAREIKKKKIILAQKNSYHGATMGALSVTGDWRHDHHQGLIPNDWTVRIPAPFEKNAVNDTEKIILQVGADRIAAICLETITGGNGVIVPEVSWWSGIQALCDKYKIFLICDEVICGFYRTGPAFGFKHYPIKPDFICMAKGISGGIIPFGAVWVKEDIAKYYDDNILCCGLTSYAHPLGLAALEGVFKITEKKEFKTNLKKLEIILEKFCRNIKKAKNVVTTRHCGMMAAIVLKETIPWENFINSNIYLVSQDKRIILAPALNYKPKVLEKALELLTKEILAHE
jgi:taurine--2-oxoglutarate transaminase